MSWLTKTLLAFANKAARRRLGTFNPGFQSTEKPLSFSPEHTLRALARLVELTDITPKKEEWVLQQQKL